METPQMGEETEMKLRVSQIVVQLVLLDEHDAPIRPDAASFAGNENGTAAENLIAWLVTLPAHLEIAAAQLAEQRPSEETA